MKSMLILFAAIAMAGCSQPAPKPDAIINSTSAFTMTQDQVNTEGASLWSQGYTKAACDAKLLADGATQYQVEQYHLAFDQHHPWPGALAMNWTYPVVKSTSGALATLFVCD